MQTPSVLLVVVGLAATSGRRHACLSGAHGLVVQPKPKETMMLRAFTTASILALTITTAQAASDVEVKVGDLDLSRPSDASVLQGRIQQAANKACDQLLWNLPTSFVFYGSWFNGCTNSTGATIARRVEARTGQYRTFASNQ
ncbi:MAG TPA: UrcA family protein [Rhizomicrobium sp.]